MRRLGVSAALVDGSWVRGDVAVADGRVAAVGLTPEVAGAGSRRKRATGLAVPGLVDLQVNGYAGVDFLTEPPPRWEVAAHAMARAGVTSFVANLITSPPEMLVEALRSADTVVAAPRAGVARLLGTHLEGPFLSPSRRGTHPADHLRAPDVSFVEPLLSAGPVVGATVAPELPGAISLVTWLRARGVLVALGHSDATAAEAHAGFDAGARAVTHIFNGMSQPTSREAGLTGVALARPDVAVQVICDGVHLAPEIVALVVASAASRFVLVSDALPATGAPDGRYRFGPVELVQVDGKARNAAGELAGSVTGLAPCIGSAVASGASLPDACAAATNRPAALLGRDDVGHLRPGSRADITVLDDNLSVTSTYISGELVI